MKRAIETLKITRNFDQLLSKLSEIEILDLHEMSCVRGGDGEGNGGEPIIIIPKIPR
jgi:hypothetical protein